MPDPKLHSCVADVKAEGDNVNPYAVCKASIDEITLNELLAIETMLIKAGYPEEAIHKYMAENYGDTDLDETVNIPGSLSGTDVLISKQTDLNAIWIMKNILFTKNQLANL